MRTLVAATHPQAVDILVPQMHSMYAFASICKLVCILYCPSHCYGGKSCWNQIQIKNKIRFRQFNLAHQNPVFPVLKKFDVEGLSLWQLPSPQFTFLSQNLNSRHYAFMMFWNVAFPFFCKCFLVLMKLLLMIADNDNVLEGWRHSVLNYCCSLSEHVANRLCWICPLSSLCQCLTSARQ